MAFLRDAIFSFLHDLAPPSLLPNRRTLKSSYHAIPIELKSRERLQFRKHHFNRVEVGAGRREVKHLRADRLDRLFYA